MPKTLNDILKNVPILHIVGDNSVKIGNITADSRNVNSATAFVAVRGTQTDGHQYIAKAIENGATVVVCESMPAVPHAVHITWVEVADSADALGIMAANYYDNPSTMMQLVGITGTNGKTTTATLLFDLFTQLGYKVGLLSTVENRIANRIVASTHTTPDPVSLNQLLAMMRDEGCEYVFMEVSSHAIHQRRIAGLYFKGGVFSNITHDHLDYHKTFQEYIYAKKRFFDDLSITAFALTNLDDKRGEVMLQNTKAKAYGYALKRLGDFKAKIIDNGLTGLHLQLDGFEFYARMIGEFNAYNLLSVYSAAVLLGQDKEDVLRILSQLQGAEGRFDWIKEPSRDVIGIVDYAHTPDALEKVLETIDKLRQKGGERIITVVGCGGDRDNAKRPIMAKIAADYSQQVILTADNPRSEDPDSIIQEMEKGVPMDLKHKILSITNREQAIKTACALAQKGDIILVAGKGHEKYQEIKGQKFPFDDKAMLIAALGMQKK